MRNPRCSLLTVLAGSALLSALPVQPASAQGTPWIAEPGTGSVNLTYANQNATGFYRFVEDQLQKVPGPLADSHLAQTTMWFGVNYALTDAVALDVQSAWASSSLPGAAGPSGGEEGYSGLFDSNVAVTWRFVDELVSDAPSVALRVGAIVAGGYDTGYINSLGDGGNAIETSLIIGKFAARPGSRERSATAPARVPRSTRTRWAPWPGTRSTSPTTCSSTSASSSRPAKSSPSASTIGWSTPCPGSTSAAPCREDPGPRKKRENESE